jgi:hypothetical protein
MAQSTCSIVEDEKRCGGSVHGYGWCSKHYMRWRRHGDPLMRLQIPGATPTERFWAKVNLYGRMASPYAGPCSEWTGALQSEGYGSFWYDGRVMLAHKWWWEQANGPVPSGLELDHLCRNRACVNLAHLEIVTKAENVRRGIAAAINTARERAKTHCPQGHPYDEANTQVRPDGRRGCCACNRARKRKARAIALKAATAGA